MFKVDWLSAVQANKLSKGGRKNFLSSGIFESLNWNGAQSFGKRHPANPHVLREDEFSSDMSDKIGWLQQNNFGIFTLILYNRSGAGFCPTWNLVLHQLAIWHWQTDTDKQTLTTPMVRFWNNVCCTLPINSILTPFLRQKNLSSELKSESVNNVSLKRLSLFWLLSFWTVTP